MTEEIKTQMRQRLDNLYLISRQANVKADLHDESQKNWEALVRFFFPDPPQKSAEEVKESV